MSILSRIRNLWRLSSYEVEEAPRGVTMSHLREILYGPQAQVVSMEDPLDIDLGDEDA